MSKGYLQTMKEFFRKKPEHPSPEVLPKECLESFSSLVASELGIALFKEFLEHEYNHENLDFWLAVEEYRKCELHELPCKAIKIYHDFVAYHAFNELNTLDDKMRSVILIRIQSSIADVHLFDEAQRRVQHVMENDSYIRFCNSKLYKKG